MKDKALALQVVREIDAAFESSERLRLGRWVLPNEREETLASFIAKAFTTVRQEARAVDAEQLIQLRKAAQMALNHLKDDHVNSNLWRLGAIGKRDIESAVEWLRAALNPDLQKET